MANNCVVPTQVRIVDAQDNFRGFHSPPRYQVDIPGLPGQVACGVLPFRFMRLRADFSSRFSGCEDAAGVRKVLVAEGFYERRIGSVITSISGI